MCEDGMVNVDEGYVFNLSCLKCSLSPLSQAKKDKDKRNVHHYLLICGKGDGMGTEIAGYSGPPPQLKP